MLAVGLVILIVSAVIFVTLAAVVLPKHMLHVKYAVNTPDDRGVKICLFKGKRCVVYKSCKENKEYIRQYALTQEDGYKLLKCKVTDAVEYMDYDIVLFNRHHEVFDVINVKEDFFGTGYSRDTRLPNETSYISIIIRKVNRVNLKKKPIIKVKGGGLLGYALVTTLLAFLETFFVRLSGSYVFGGVYRESFIATTEGFVFNLAVSLLIGILTVITVVASIKKRAKK